MCSKYIFVKILEVLYYKHGIAENVQHIGILKYEVVKCEMCLQKGAD